MTTGLRSGTGVRSGQFFFGRSIERPTGKSCGQISFFLTLGKKKRGSRSVDIAWIRWIKVQAGGCEEAGDEEKSVLDQHQRRADYPYLGVIVPNRATRPAGHVLYAVRDQWWLAIRLTSGLSGLGIAALDLIVQQNGAGRCTREPLVSIRDGVQGSLLQVS